MSADYSHIKIRPEQAQEIAKSLYNLEGEIKILPGELDFNFRIKTKSESYILKISRPNEDLEYLEFQKDILQYLSESDLMAPKIFPDIHGKYISSINDAQGNKRFVRLLSWIDGRLWASVNPIKDDLLYSLGTEAGKITNALEGFEHKKIHREFDWDIAQAEWTFKHLELFSAENLILLTYFIIQFYTFQNTYRSICISLVNNRDHENNIRVSTHLIDPEVPVIFDYDNAIDTQSINDLAVAMAYASMDNPDL